MCVWTKKRGSMNAVVLMATACPKSLHGKGEKWIARNILPGLDSRQPMTAMTERKRVDALMMMMFLTGLKFLFSFLPFFYSTARCPLSQKGWQRGDDRNSNRAVAAHRRCHSGRCPSHGDSRVT